VTSLPPEVGPWLEYDGDVSVVEMIADAQTGSGWRSSGNTIPARAWFRTVHEDPVPFLHTPEGYLNTDSKPVQWVGIIEGDIDLMMELEGKAGLLFVVFPSGSRAACHVTEHGPGEMPRSARVVSFDPPPEGSGWQER
jgi:hypothetical protein